MKIAILGYGTVGKGVFEIASKLSDIKVVKILDKEEKFDKQYIELFTNKIENIVNDDEIELVVETLGGYDFAYNCIKNALMNKKHVVTANKEVVALKIDELLDIAKTNNVCFMFEASVGGGIPIIKNLFELKRSNEIKAIRGILNGTTNYILTSVANGTSFEDSLKQAQELGFAEANPTADLEGFDMMRKIAILSDIAWNIKISLDDIKHIGVTNISDEDYLNAKNNNKVIKFVASAIKTGNSISLCVKPILLEKSDILANINYETNAVVVSTYPNDELTFIGKGAGSLPTASAIISDIYNIINNRVLMNYKNENILKVNN